jgi:hypothetical protein
MSKALQQLWVRRCEVGIVAVVLITSALLLTFVITAHDAQSLAKVALELPGTFFALLTTASLTFDYLLPERLVFPLEPFLAIAHGRSPPA